MGRHYRPRVHECDHLTTKVVETVNKRGKSIKKLICTEEGGCCRFIKWILNDANQNKVDFRNYSINYILREIEVTDWEKTFLEKMKNLKRLSPLQQKKYDEIIEKYRCQTFLEAFFKYENDSSNPA